jgi:thiamine-monophosphate kinase
MNEFELIARYFARSVPSPLVAQAGGDDCALLQLGDRQLALTTDLLLEGRHFLANVDPAALGHKALAVNLSDLAAAGATPRCFLLALALPRLDEAWLAAFSDGLYALADAHGCALIGGDTTRAPRIEERDGPLAICITALGEVPSGAALGRAGARDGDDLWVSGTLGDAALALRHLTGEVALPDAAAARVRVRLEWPTPRVAFGSALRGLATACLDVSDGLAGDAGHIAARSGVQVIIEYPLEQSCAPSQRRCNAPVRLPVVTTTNCCLPPRRPAAWQLLRSRSRPAHRWRALATSCRVPGRVSSTPTDGPWTLAPVATIISPEAVVRATAVQSECP